MTVNKDREQCYICGMTYSNRNTLYVHMHSKHRKQARKLDKEQFDGLLHNNEVAGNTSAPHSHGSLKDIESHGAMQSVTKASGKQVMNIQKRLEPSFNFREHICNICTAVFDRPKKLANHKKKHIVVGQGDEEGISNSAGQGGADSNTTAAEGKEGQGEGARVTNSTHKTKHIVEGQGGGVEVSNVAGQGSGDSKNAAAGKEGTGEGAGEPDSASAFKPGGVSASTVEGGEKGVPSSTPLGQESSQSLSDSGAGSKPRGAPDSSATTQDDDHGVSNSAATKNNPGEVGNATTRDQDDRVPNLPSVGKVDGVSNSVVVASKPNNVLTSTVKDQTCELSNSTEDEAAGISNTTSVG